VLESYPRYAPLETTRLHLEVPRPEHAAAIFKSFSSDPEVTRYLRWTPAQTLADSEAAMAKRLGALESGVELSWILVLKSDTGVVGSLSVWPRGVEAELGFALARNVWGRGLAAEAGHAAIKWLRATGKFRRVWASCDAANPRSKRALEKLGLQYERLAENYAVHPNLSSAPRDCHVLGLELVAV
jgi:ribosomal-protein-alanine N-acetyltransferase